MAGTELLLNLSARGDFFAFPFAIIFFFSVQICGTWSVTAFLDCEDGCQMLNMQRKRAGGSWKLPMGFVAIFSENSWKI